MAMPVARVSRAVTTPRGPLVHYDEMGCQRSMAMDDHFLRSSPVVAAVVVEATRGQKAEGEGEQEDCGLAHH